MQPRKVLVVDDSKLMHKMYEVMLRQYPLVYALDGRQALDRLRDHRDIELVLLDIQIPGLGGWEVAARIRATSETFCSSSRRRLMCVFSRSSRESIPSAMV